jgi:acyl-CoA synthetase (AMP-forming)/AMP-acid ligase II
MECGLLDGAVWQAITRLLQDPEWIEAEVARLREQPDPGQDAITGIDRQIAELDNDIAACRAYAMRVIEPREQTAADARMTELWRRRDGLVATREAAHAHYASLAEQRRGLEATMDWCRRAADKMEAADFDRKRLILAALHAKVTLYRTDETPRATLTVSLPLSGVRDVPLSIPATQPDKGITAPYKYPHEIECVAELPKTISGKIRRVELRERQRKAGQAQHQDAGPDAGPAGDAGTSSGSASGA